MNRKINILSLVLLVTTSYMDGHVDGLNILGIFPYPGQSHFFVYRVYLQELASRGHSVTVISHYPEEKPVENYHDISLAGSTAKVIPPVGVNNFPFLKIYLLLLYRGTLIMTSGRESCKVMLANEEVQRLISQKPKFDLVVVEQFNSDCALGVAYKLHAPVIGINSFIIMPWHYSRFGIPQNPSFVPFPYLHGGTKPTLVQKVEAIFFNLYFKVLYHFYEQSGDQNTLAQYFDDIPPLESLAREIKFHLVYHNFVLTGSRLFPANVIEVGGYHVRAKPLPEDLQKFMDEAEHGVIYISFGSVIRSSTMPTDQIDVVIGAMKDLPQRFIWKWENSTVIMDKNKLYVSSWLPQVDILAHPKTLAFLSHAGMGGTTESIHYGVPMVAMPMFAEQPANAAAIEESGLGVRIQVDNLTKENLLSAFNKVLDPKFKENVKKISQVWHDRPMPPLETAMYWTEFAARYSNFTFRAPSADVPLYQYFNLDIIIVYIVVILLIFFIFKCATVIICNISKYVNYNTVKSAKKKPKKEK